MRKAVKQLKTKKMKSQFERQRDMRSAESITTDYHSSGEEDRHRVGGRKISQRPQNLINSERNLEIFEFSEIFD